MVQFLWAKSLSHLATSAEGTAKATCLSESGESPLNLKMESYYHHHQEKCNWKPILLLEQTMFTHHRKREWPQGHDMVNGSPRKLFISSRRGISCCPLDNAISNKTTIWWQQIHPLLMKIRWFDAVTKSHWPVARLILIKRLFWNTWQQFIVILAEIIFSLKQTTSSFCIYLGNCLKIIPFWLTQSLVNIFSMWNFSNTEVWFNSRQ